jgi:hypothetical protein
MKTIRGQILFTFSALLLLSVTVRGDEPLPRTGALGSGANIGQAVLGQTSSLTSTATAPLTQGLGQIVSGWAHQGILGTELAERIHQLQATRFDQREDLREKLRDLRQSDDRNTAEKIGSLGGRPANAEGLGDRFNPGQPGPRGSFGNFKFPGRGRR